MESVETSVLLHRYAEEGCQESFRVLMHRYVDLIYSAALRRLEGDGATAEDVVQRVFAELAVQARSLKADSRLGGWLYRCAVRFAADIHKASVRRRTRELKAAALSPVATPEPDAWEEVAPRLDDAMQHLPAGDRDALVLRFFEDRPLRAVGDALGLSEDAAQKRVSRALIRLRGLLQRRGVAATASGLAAGLTTNSVVAAPTGLVPAVLPAATAYPLVFHTLMNAKPLIAAAAIVAAVAIPLFLVLRHTDASGTSGRHVASSERSGPSAQGPSADSSNPLSLTLPGNSRPAGKKAAASSPPEESPLATAEAEAKNRKRAEEVTLQRYTEKMERLTLKLNLTPEQAEKIGAYHQAQRAKWIEYITGAAAERADAKYYQLETGYREDVPPPLQALLSEDQLKLYHEHDTNKRTNHIEAVTSGEINYLAQRLDLNPQKKDELFQKLADINRVDLFTDLSSVNDLAGISRQADQDLARRRSEFVSVLDEQQMKVWETVAAGYHRELLHRFGQRDSATAGAAEKAAASSSNG